MNGHCFTSLKFMKENVPSRPSTLIPYSQSILEVSHRKDSTSDWTFTSLTVIVLFNWLLILSHIAFIITSGSVVFWCDWDDWDSISFGTPEPSWSDWESWCMSAMRVSLLIVDDGGGEDWLSGVSRMNVWMWRLYWESWWMSSFHGPSKKSLTIHHWSLKYKPSKITFKSSQ